MSAAAGVCQLPDCLTDCICFLYKHTGTSFCTCTNNGSR